MIDNIERSIVKEVLPALDGLQKEATTHDELSDNILFSQLKLKSDSDFFKRVDNIVSKYKHILSDLKQRVAEELPDTITSNTHNLNSKIALALVSEGIFLSIEILEVFAYIIATFYTKSDSDLEKGVKLKNANKLMTLIKMIPELEKSDLDKVVKTIGNIPTIKTLKQEDESTIPVDLVMDFFSDSFGIKDFYTQTLTKRFMGYFKFKEERKAHADISRNFIGNPIYHLRIFLIDMQVLRLEGYKEDVQLLELRLLELRNQNSNTPNAEVSKAIAYYETKVNKLKLKIEKIREQN